jgi:predicted Ser/Thr protein kinase
MAADTGPDKINRYEIQGLIARGGMGRIYLARDPNTGRLVVIKLLDATLESSEVRDRFDREAKSLASLSHPSIVHIYDYGNYQESPFIVMEYVRGETLEEKIKRRARQSLSDKLGLMSELCAGLAHAHQSGIIHRDVKPANLMVDQDDRLKILDFGIARVADSNLTRVQTSGGWSKLQIGTPGYMSPEQTRGDEIDHRTDVFSVGAVCYELLSYREAFPGATPKEIEAKVMRTPPEPLRVQVPDLEPEIDQILARAMARDPNDRYQDAAALEEAFERCRERLDPSGTAVSSRRPTPPATAASKPPGSRADATYARATAAFEEKAFDVARRLALEALAEDSAHAGARALLARLDPRQAASAARPARPLQASPTASSRPARPEPRGPAPETISVDPTVLIDRASRPPAPPDRIEPTMVIQRDELRRRVADTDPAAILPRPGARPPAPVAEPTVMVPAVRRHASPPPRAKSGASSGGFLQSLWLRLTTLGRGAPSQQGRHAPARGAAPPARARQSSGMTPTMRGALIAVGAVAVASLFVLAVLGASRWFVTTGQVLTIVKPMGGTIVGAGIRCGTRGSDCSVSLKDGEAVELQPEPDSNFVFSGYTGPCAPTGRVVMSEARTCGATFSSVADNREPVQWPLTITKPTGGSIVAIGGILCGTLGDTCTAKVPDGERVALRVQSEPGQKFLAFTGDCAEGGETLMTAARTCGATFGPTTAPSANDVPTGRPPTVPAGPAGPVGPGRPGKPTPTAEIARGTGPSAPPGTAPTSPTGTGQPAAGSGQPPASPGGGAPAGTQAQPNPQTPIPTDANPKPAAAPITEEEHAKKEIEGLVKQYCAELETLNPARVQKVFPLARQEDLREQFRQYKSLKCAVAGAAEYDRFDVKGAGGAQLKIGMKQTIEMKSGGAPKTYETIATIIVSRMNLQSPWLIDRVNHLAKPKP